MNLKLAVAEDRPFDRPAQRATQDEPIPATSSVPRGAHYIALLAVRSLHRELALYPKPGLVSLIDNGAHRDMDAATFVRSLFSLRGYFAAIAAAGMCAAGFAELQRLGLAAEARMLRATCGINTHRGAIFTLGILAAAAGHALARNIAPSDQNLRAIVLANWSRELRAIALAVHATQPRAIDGRAPRRRRCARRSAAGIPFGVRDRAAGFAQRAGAWRRHGTCTAACVLPAAGGDHGHQRAVSRRSRRTAIHPDAGRRVPRARQRIRRRLAGSMRKPCIAAARQRNLSPGGCADLLSAAWFVHLLQTGQPMRAQP